MAIQRFEGCILMHGNIGRRSRPPVTGYVSIACAGRWRCRYCRSAQARTAEVAD